MPDEGASSGCIKASRVLCGLCYLGVGICFLASGLRFSQTSTTDAFLDDVSAAYIAAGVFLFLATMPFFAASGANAGGPCDTPPDTPCWKEWGGWARGFFGWCHNASIGFYCAAAIQLILVGVATGRLNNSDVMSDSNAYNEALGQCYINNLVCAALILAAFLFYMLFTFFYAQELPESGWGGVFKGGNILILMGLCAAGINHLFVGLYWQSFKTYYDTTLAGTAGVAPTKPDNNHYLLFMGYAFVFFGYMSRAFGRTSDASPKL